MREMGRAGGRKVGDGGEAVGEKVIERTHRKVGRRKEREQGGAERWEGIPVRREKGEKKRDCKGWEGR